MSPERSRSIGPYRYLAYDDARSEPNIVVDGSPNAGTVCTLSHWPGIAQPPNTDVDTSAEMVFAYIDHPLQHPPAEVVTNNHFDQDGAVGLLALIDPSTALAHRELLVDLAAAGDFGVFRSRAAARASMTLHAMADPIRSPWSDQLIGDPDADAALLYRSVLPLLAELVVDPMPYRHLWESEDDALSASEQAIAGGRVVISEYPDLDLAVVDVDGAEPARVGHRFTHMNLGPLHPMAINNATKRSRLLLCHRSTFSYVDRYESWVQLRTRIPPPRTDVRPLAEALTGAEAGGTRWCGDPPSKLMPILSHDGSSTLTSEDVVGHVQRHLQTAPPAWNPYCEFSTTTRRAGR